MKTVYILRGVPGCGKSSVADELHSNASRTGRTALICSSDDFFMDHDGNYNWDLEKLGHAHMWCMHEFKCGLADGIDVVIVSNTNIHSSDVKAYHDVAKEVGYMIFVLTVENWHDGEDVHNVPTEVKLAMSDTLRQNVKGFAMPMVEVKGTMMPMYKRNKDTTLYEVFDYFKPTVQRVKRVYTTEEIDALKKASREKKLKNK